MVISIDRAQAFVRMIGCIAAFGFLLSAVPEMPGPAEGAERIVFGHILDESTAHHRNMVRASQEIERQLKGRHQVHVVPKGQIGITDAQIIEGFDKGIAQMAYLSFGHLVNLYPPLAIGAGPFVFRDFRHWEAFRDSGLFQELVSEFEKKTDMKVLGLAYYGERHVTAKKPLTDLESLKNLSIRVPNIPTMILTFRALGARPVPIPFNETYQALKDGIVDAQENPLPAIRAMRFYEVTNVVNLTAHITDAQLVVMSGARWRALAASDKKVFETVFSEAARKVTDDVRREELDLQKSMQKEGVIMHVVDRAPMIESVLAFYRGNKFPWSSELYERVQALK